MLPAPLRALGLAVLVGGCGPTNVIAGTKVVDTQTNRELLEVCERYRHALEDRDVEALASMAAPSYFEDSGTPRGDDDYGYEGLVRIINARLPALKSVRYNVQYQSVEVKGKRAHVDIRYDASFQLATELGDRWERKQNEKRLELEFNGKKWLFVAGM